MKKTMAVLVLAMAWTVAASAAEGSASDEGSGTESKAVKLFNGKDFTGWKLYADDKNADLTKTWTVEDKVIRCTGSPAGYIRTTKKYENYTLTWQWRWPEKGGNSGCLLHADEPDKVWPKSIECQLQSKSAADFWVIGGTDFKEHTNKDDRRVPKKSRHNEKKLGEWNKGMAVCDGNTIKVYINDELQNEATDTTVTKGYIGFQSEGTPIEFRKIRLEPLKEK